MNKTELETRLDNLKNKISEASHSDEDKINKLTGREIRDCLKDQMELQMKWEKIVSEAVYLYSEAEVQSEEEFAKAFVEKHGDNYADLSTSEAKYYASTKKEYIDAKRNQNTAYGLKKKAEGILETIETRKYALKTYSDLIIAGAEKWIL